MGKAALIVLGIIGGCLGWWLVGPAIGFVVFSILITVAMVINLGNAQRPKGNNSQPKE